MSESLHRACLHVYCFVHICVCVWFADTRSTLHLYLHFLILFSVHAKYFSRTIVCVFVCAWVRWGVRLLVGSHDDKVIAGKISNTDGNLMLVSKSPPITTILNDPLIHWWSAHKNHHRSQDLHTWLKFLISISSQIIYYRYMNMIILYSQLFLCYPWFPKVLPSHKKSGP